MPESPPVMRAHLPSSLPAALYFGASYRGFGSSFDSSPTPLCFCFAKGGLGSLWIWGWADCALALLPSSPLFPCAGVRVLLPDRLVLAGMWGSWNAANAWGAGIASMQSTCPLCGSVRRGRTLRSSVCEELREDARGVRRRGV